MAWNLLEQHWVKGEFGDHRTELVAIQLVLETHPGILAKYVVFL
jgi:hypothetical protein